MIRPVYVHAYRQTSTNIYVCMQSCIKIGPWSPKTLTNCGSWHSFRVPSTLRVHRSSTPSIQGQSYRYSRLIVTEQYACSFLLFPMRNLAIKGYIWQLRRLLHTRLEWDHWGGGFCFEKSGNVAGESSVHDGHGWEMEVSSLLSANKPFVCLFIPFHVRKR